MPFVSEEVWQLLKERKQGDSITISSWPKSTGYDETLIAQFEDVKEAIAGLRTIRTKNNIPKYKISSNWPSWVGDKGFVPEFNSVLVKMGNLSASECSDGRSKNWLLHFWSNPPPSLFRWVEQLM